MTQFKLVLHYDVEFDQWILGDGDSKTPISADVLEFASHLSSVKNLVIKRDRNKNYHGSMSSFLRITLQEIRNANPHAMIYRFWQFAQALKGKRDLDNYTVALTLYASDVDIHYQNERILFEVEDNRKFYLEYGLNIQGYLDTWTQWKGEEFVKALQVTIKGLDLRTPTLAHLIANLLTRFTGLQQFDINYTKKRMIMV